MANISLPTLGVNNTTLQLATQTPTQTPTQTEDVVQAVPDASDDLDATLDSSTSFVLTPAQIKMKQKADNIVGTMSALDKELFKGMCPDLRQRLGLDRIDKLAASMSKRIETQETMRWKDYSRPNVHRSVPVPETTTVDTLDALGDMLRMMSDHISLANASSYDPALSVDSEGPLSLLQVMVIKPHRAYLIDVPALGAAAFNTSVTTAQEDVTLNMFFEASNVLKLLWDCRGDGGKIKQLQNVSMDCVYDIQLMDLATREHGERKKTLSLGHAGPQRLQHEIDQETRSHWSTHKLFGKLTFKRGYPNVSRAYDDAGGDYSTALKILADRGQDLQLEPILDAAGKETGRFLEDEQQHDDPFLIRPIPEYLQIYAIDDVRFLPAMFDHFVKHRYWTDEWADRVWKESGLRLGEGEGEAEGRGHDAPRGWDPIRQVDKTAVV